MDSLELIILYGGVGDTSSGKVQSLIDEKLTCGYREYARCANKGVIIYMSPQDNIKYQWEKCIPNWREVVDFCNHHKNARVWSIKYDSSKNKILERISNFKIHYSCCARNTYDPLCNISLVDTPDRIKKKNHRLFFKGKDPDFWRPIKQEKKYDYVLCGKRDDKNQSTFINLLNSVQTKRSVLWIGGQSFKRKISSIHSVNLTGPVGPKKMVELLSQAKVGILYSEIKEEGFPQTLLEMTMCGVPVIYNGPINKTYIHTGSCVLTPKKSLIKSAEDLLNNYDSDQCRKIAIENYGIEKSLNLIRNLK